MFGRKSDNDVPEKTTVLGDEADAVLDHALREQAVDDQQDEFDDGLGDDADESTDQTQPASGDQEDYVLYADVKPHLEELVALQGERIRLIDLLLYARDRVSSPAAAERIDDGLRRLGIEALRPDGELFDPSQHEAAATVVTQDKALHGHIAETETAGYSDNGRIVRPPIVTVYRASAPASA